MRRKNSTSTNCEGSGCINHEFDYQTFGCFADIARSVLIPGKGLYCMAMVENLPPCSEEVEQLAKYGLVIGGITRIAVANDMGLADWLDKLGPKYTKYAKWVSRGSGYILIIDLSLMGYCELTRN